ncbi:hypothetical protein HJFPF1_01642 [Paramyrothecium foliicola]|nr:hypothetical protein HJFPF1_01642 [Paramyrothecium foliicola]
MSHSSIDADRFRRKIEKLDGLLAGVLGFLLPYFDNGNLQGSDKEYAFSAVVNDMVKMAEELGSLKALVTQGSGQPSDIRVNHGEQRSPACAALPIIVPEHDCEKDGQSFVVKAENSPSKRIAAVFREHEAAKFQPEDGDAEVMASSVAFAAPEPDQDDTPSLCKEGQVDNSRNLGPTVVLSDTPVALEAESCLDHEYQIVGSARVPKQGAAEAAQLEPKSELNNPNGVVVQDPPGPVRLSHGRLDVPAYMSTTNVIASLISPMLMSANSWRRIGAPDVVSRATRQQATARRARYLARSKLAESLMLGPRHITRPNQHHQEENLNEDSSGYAPSPKRVRMDVQQM